MAVEVRPTEACLHAEVGAHLRLVVLNESVP